MDNCRLSVGCLLYAECQEVVYMHNFIWLYLHANPGSGFLQQFRWVLALCLLARSCNHSIIITHRKLKHFDIFARTATKAGPITESLNLFKRPNWECHMYPSSFRLVLASWSGLLRSVGVLNMLLAMIAGFPSGITSPIHLFGTSFFSSKLLINYRVGKDGWRARRIPLVFLQGWRLVTMQSFLDPCAHLSYNTPDLASVLPKSIKDVPLFFIWRSLL